MNFKYLFIFFATTIFMLMSEILYAQRTDKIKVNNLSKPVLRDKHVSGQGDFYFMSTPSRGYVFIDNKLILPVIKAGIPSGMKQFYTKKSEYRGSRTLFSEQNELKENNIIRVRAKGKLSISGNPSGAYVAINKRPIGKIPLNNYELSWGSYYLEVHAKGYENHSETIFIKPNDKLDMIVHLKKKSNTKALVRSVFVPGLGQLYLGKPTKALLFPILEIGAIASANVFLNQYNSAVNDYNKIRENYSNATDQSVIDNYYSQMEEKFDDIESAERLRNIFIGAALGIWLWNVVDASLLGPATEKKTSNRRISNKNVQLYLDNNRAFSRVGICFNF